MQSAPRVDLYGTIHKALRARLFDLGIELDRCDFTMPLEVTVALGAYRRTIGFLREHHAHEDTFIGPALARCGQEVERQHTATDADLAALDALVATITHGPAAGSELCAKYRSFLIGYLAHMNHEETVVNAELWQHYSDAELMDLRGRLQRSIPPPRFGEWLEIILPAANLEERTGMLRGIQANAPAPVFAAASAIASRVLGDAGWDAVRVRLEL